jgi:hypothetical protein
MLPEPKTYIQAPTPLYPARKMGCLDQINLKINHEARTVNEALGISDKQAKQITQRVVTYMSRAERISQTIEAILKDPELNDAEKIYAIFILGTIRVVRVLSPIRWITAD